MLIVPTYVPGSDRTILNSLLTYIRLKMMKVDQANAIIDRIG
jgi:hypothetical protein